MPPTVTSRDLKSAQALWQPLALERELVVAAPVVPGAAGGAGVAAGRAEGVSGQSGAGAGMAVRHARRAGGQAVELADALRRCGPSGRVEQAADVEVPGAGNVALPRVALVAAPTGELVGRADVEDRQRLVAEPSHEL